MVFVVHRQVSEVKDRQAEENGQRRNDGEG